LVVACSSSNSLRFVRLCLDVFNAGCQTHTQCKGEWRSVEVHARTRVERHSAERRSFDVQALGFTAQCRGAGLCLSGIVLRRAVSIGSVKRHSVEVQASAWAA
jgi:hypothetical protein